MMVVLMSPHLLAEEGGAEGHHGFDWFGFLGKVINSTILFGGLIYVLRKPITEVLAQKSADVKADIVDREERVVITARQLEEIKSRLEKIEEEVAAMKLAATETGKIEQQRITELATHETQRIVELTDAEIASRTENAVRNLKAKIATLTIDHFKQEIEKQLLMNCRASAKPP